MSQTVPADTVEATRGANPKRPAEGMSEQVHEVRGTRAVGVREEMEELKEVGAFGIWLRSTIKATPSWLVSLIFHMVVMLVLAMIYVGDGNMDRMGDLVIAPTDEDSFDELEEPEDDLLDEPIDISTDVVDVLEDPMPEDFNLSTEDVEPPQMTIKMEDFGIPTAAEGDILDRIGTIDGTGEFGGRTQEGRQRLGTPQSNAAVAMALEWFARHQLPDGGWSFDHTMHPGCRGQCRNPGNLRQARNAATAMALLPFLGAGQTHRDGAHKKTVQGGLYYLINNMKVSNRGGSLHEPGGSMYSHGLAAIALTEAYGMTQDRALLQPAQAAVNYICYAQDPVGGGWRYQPRQAGDTSVVGWQLMALKSAHMSYLQVPPQVIKKASQFLDSVQANSGASYGYTGPGEGPATTSIGLLSRMYLGWNKENPALQRGVERISKMGVSKKGNMYFNYYATQVARHWEGEVWEKWNDQMHDWLVNSQAKEGHEKGSWYFGGDRHGDRGGRHYVTSMATMMLEVYYRHMPIYRKVATDDDFAL